MDLQSQFSRWQEQLIENQKMLTKKHITVTTPAGQPQPPQRAASMSSPSDTELSKPSGQQNKQKPELRKARSEVDVYSQRETLLAEIRKKTPLVEAHSTDETVAALTSSKYEPVISKRKPFTKRDYSSSANDSSSFQSSNPVKISSSQFANKQQQLQPQEGSPTSDKHQPNRSLETRSSTVAQTLPPPPPPISIAPSPSKSDAPPSRSFSAGNANSRTGSRSRFEPKLDPREELMIAIRNAAGGKGILRQVRI